METNLTYSTSIVGFPRIMSFAVDTVSKSWFEMPAAAILNSSKSNQTIPEALATKFPRWMFMSTNISLKVLHFKDCNTSSMKLNSESYATKVTELAEGKLWTNMNLLKCSFKFPMFYINPPHPPNTLICCSSLYKFVVARVVTNAYFNLHVI